jgi:hypothetical protein
MQYQELGKLDMQYRVDKTEPRARSVRMVDHADILHTI